MLLDKNEYKVRNINVLMTYSWEAICSIHRHSRHRNLLSVYDAAQPELSSALQYATRY